MPLVSVVIPTYNHAAFVLQTLDSVFAHTFTDYEVIVVNDGSPDNTAAILAPMVASGRIRYIEQANRGQAAARNRGILEAGGEFIALLDDDDLWEADKLQWQVEALRNRPDCVLVYGQLRTFGDGLHYTTPEAGAKAGTAREDFVTRVWINSPGQTLIHAAAIRRIGGFDAGIWGTDDWDLYLNLAECGGFLYIPRVALNYRYHAANASKDVGRLWLNALHVVEKHFGRKGVRPDAFHWRESRSFVKRFIGEDCFRHADFYAARGDFESARTLLKFAIRVDPRRNFKRSAKWWLRHRHPRRERIVRDHFSLLRRRLSARSP